MNPATAFATVVVDELVRGGVEDAVLAPGSRSAPMALAFAAAERAGWLRLHVRTDERSAGFLALGLAKGSGRPVPVLTTSGTATAHLHAAVLEASYSGVPLLALTADRPPEMRGTGANQTIDQVGLYGGATRFAADVDVPQRLSGSNDRWRSLVCQALARARGLADRRPGAVHLNLPLRSPLLPGQPEPGDQADEGWPESLDGRPCGLPWMTTKPTDRETDRGRLTIDQRAAVSTWMVLGDTSATVSELAVAVAQRNGWPILAEPTGNAGAAAVPGYLGLLESRGFMDRHGPLRVVCVGRPTLSRAVQGLLADESVDVERYAFGPQWTLGLPLADLDAASGNSGTALIELLAEAGDALSRRQDQILEESYLGGARVARDMMRQLPVGSRLFVGSSTPIRDVDRYARPRDGVQVLGNRGVAGIDGSISTAVGLALTAADGPTFALLGDLAFLHDLSGLVIPDTEVRPDLTIVVVDNRGGGIFAQLEPGGADFEQDYDRVFGTPHQVDLVEVARSLCWDAELVSGPEEFGTALERGGPRVIVIRTDQRTDAEILRSVRAVQDTIPPS